MDDRSEWSTDQKQLIFRAVTVEQLNSYRTFPAVTLLGAHGKKLLHLVGVESGNTRGTGWVYSAWTR